jgi:protein SMG8
MCIVAEGGVCKPHSSGVMFLHACACGRSRKLRKDPFDYESANVTFFQFPNCEDQLPSLALPASSSDNYLGGSAWSLVRLGSARYYQPNSGLMQIGFIPEEKHLSLLDIVVLYESNSAAVALPGKTDVTLETHKAAIETDHSNYTLSRTQNGSVDPKQGAHAEQNFYSKIAEKGSLGENNRVAGRTSTSRMDKVKVSTSSSSNVNYGGDSAFPPLPQKAKKLQSGAPPKAPKPSSVMERPDGVEEPRPGARNDILKNTMVGYDMASLKIDAGKEDKEPVYDPLFVDSGKTSSVQRFQVYVGFEHECPHGHRFLLSSNQLQNIGVSYPQPGPGHVNLDQDAVIRPDPRISVINEQPVTTSITSRGTLSDKKTREGSEVMRIIKGSGDGNLLLGMDLPIYMHCPHCEASAGREEKQEDMVYAGCVSQLQRIFLVLLLELMTSQFLECCLFLS